MFSTNGCITASAAFKMGKLAPQMNTTLTSDASASQERELDEGAIASGSSEETNCVIVPRNLQTVDA